MNETRFTGSPSPASDGTGSPSPATDRAGSPGPATDGAGSPGLATDGAGSPSPATDGAGQPPDVARVMALPIAQQLLRDEPILHLSYTGRDGGPRVIPIGYVWDGDSFVMWTVPISAKVSALKADPRVAVTIDVPGPPPRVLLARGRATLITVDGVPDGYLQASHRTMPADAWDGFDTQVRALYQQMTTITITPEWARLLDFETTLPAAVETLVREQSTAGP